MSLSYEECLKIVRGLEATKKYGLDGNPIVERIAKLMHEKVIKDLPLLDTLLECYGESISANKVARPMRINLDVVSEYLIDQITPWVKALRKRFFGSVIAPFANVEDVLHWYEKALEDADKKISEDEDRLRRQVPFFDAYDDYRRHLPKRTILTSESLPPKILKKVPKPMLLREKAEDIAAVTGFNSTWITMFILMDIKPIMPRFEWKLNEARYKLPSGSELGNRFVTLTIRSELTFQELYALYHNIRHEMGVKRLKGFNERHLELYVIVRDLRQKGNQRLSTVAFWQSVRNEWNTKHPDHTYGTWKGVKIAYDRLQKKLITRYWRGGDNM